MKKYKMSFLALLLVCSICDISGCGQRIDDKEDKGNEGNTNWTLVQESGGDSDQAQSAAGNAASVAQESVPESGEAPGDQLLIRDENGGILEGVIADQSFEVELDGWGKVMFVSVAPAEVNGKPRFVLAKDGFVVYTFPESGLPKADEFVEVSAVSFTDYNEDGKKDVVALTRYRNGSEVWSEADIFLQENSDNMFYIDYPDMKGYRIEAAAKGGPAFYKDSLLEEYLLTQRLTDTISSVTGTWTAYIDYVDGLHGYLGEDEQLALLAESRDIWAQPVDFADDLYCFTVAGLTYDGHITLIVSNYGGTGHYTYSRFYKIDDEGNLKEIETSFTEGDSQPDIITEQMTVYTSFSSEGMRDHYIVYDEIRVSPDSFVYRASSLCLTNDYILETPLARQTVTYEGEDWAPHTVSEDCNYNLITEEEYENFPETYYENMGLSESTVYFQWIDVSELADKSDAEAVELLRQAYAGFRRE